MKRFVVTGALGHIGSLLIRELPVIFPGCQVVMIDNMSVQRYCSLFNLPDEGRYKFIEGDVCKIDLPSIFKDADAIIHFAAITDAAGSFGNADEVKRNNFDCTKAVAEACIETGVPMVFPSSTSVYGVQEGEVDEDCPADLLKPQSPYAESKIEEEQLLEELFKTRKLRVAICRFGTIFGISSGMRFHTAVNKFCWQAVMGIPLTIWSTAYEQYRPYLDVMDAVRAIEHIIVKDLFAGKILNVVSDNFTVKDIVEAIQKNISDLEIEFVEHKIMNQLSYKVINRRMLDSGFKINGSIENGVRETIALLRQSNS